MDRKKIIYFILLIAGILSLVLSQIVESEFAILLFVVYVPFHIISLIFYRESKMITAYHIFQTFNLFGYFMMHQFLGNFFRLFGIISYFGAFITIILAFGVVLQNKSFKLNERSFLWFSIYGFVFFSLYQPYILNFIANFFGPFPIQMRRAADIFFLIRTILLGGNVVLQILCVKNNEINLYLDEQERKNKTESNKVSDLPFFN